MRLMHQAWQANTFDDWLLASAIVVSALLALVLLKLLAVRALKLLAERTHASSADILVKIANATRPWLLFPLALYAGASALELPGKIDRAMDMLAAVAVMLQAALWINRLICCWMDRQFAQRRTDNGEAVTALALLGFAGRVVVWTIALLLILKHLSFDVTALVAGLGVGGVAVALAVQNILGDLFASLSIVLDKPFVVGDFIVVDNLRGTVEQVGIKTTRLRSLDGELLVFSNADLLKSRIRNFKRMFHRRVEFTVSVSYQTPLDILKRIPQWLRAIVEAQERARFDRAHFKQYGESSLVFEIVYGVLDADYNVYMDVQQAVNLAIFERFAREGVEFAYPTRTLHVRQEPASLPARG